MSNELEESPKDRAIKLLPDDERNIWNGFKESGKPGLAPTVCAAFFELFLNGSTVYEIQKLNKAFDIGAIIDAKIRFGWEEQKIRYTQELQGRAVNRLLQVQSESVQFLADAMAATHKKHGSALKKYLQSGNEQDLDGFDLGSITTYSRAIEALLKVTGQDQKKKVTVDGVITNNVNLPGNMGKKALTPDQAAAVLQILADDEENPGNAD